MCLYPKLIRNPRYTKTKKNGGVIPPLVYYETAYVPVGCGKCIECLKQKSNEWRIRLHEELKANKYSYFITLTFNAESLEYLRRDIKSDDVNKIATRAVRLFLERYRRKYKKSIKHWLITELGQDNTERIHLHGIIFPPFEINNEWLEDIWKYGITDKGKYCNSKTINYIVKYLYKIDSKHKNYSPIILCSKGIGNSYINRISIEKHKYNGKNTVEYYTLPNGQRINLPIYYRNKLWDDGDRERLWIQRVREDTRYVNGIKIEKSSNENYNTLLLTLQQAQKENKQLGYGDSTWKKENYHVTLEMLNKK